MENIKSYREKELKAYAVANVLLILFASGYLGEIVTGENTTFLAMVEELITSALFGSIIYIYVFLADSVIPGNWKDRICFPCGMPGSKIFKQIQDGRCQDERIDKAAVLEQYKDLYRKKDFESAQNSFWMKIYRSHEKSTRIFVSQRDFLLCRDMTAMTVWVLLLYCAAWILGFVAFDWRIIVVFIVEGLFAWLAAKSKGWRYAYNVISEDLYKEKEKTDDNEKKLNAPKDES